MKTYSNQFAKFLQRVFKLKIGDMSSSEISPIIQPIILVLEDGKVKSATNINSTTQTLITTDLSEDTYIDEVELSFVKDNTATTTYTRITGYVNGTQITLLQFPHLTLTANSGSTRISFVKPILLDKNTAVAITHSTNVANISSSCTIHYHN